MEVKEPKVDTQVSIEEPTYSADSIPEKQNFPQNRGVEIVSVDEDAILDQKKNSNINASKQSSLEKAIDNLMNQTETE